MLSNDNERMQEFFLLLGDKLAPVGKKWWYALIFTLVLMIPGYYVLKSAFVSVALSRYRAPQIIYTSAIKQPLEVLDKKIFSLPNNTYSGYVKVRNANLEWGVPRQEYTATFKTLGGTTVTSVNGSTFILPGADSLIIFSRFSAQQKPEEVTFNLSETHFVHKPDVQFNYNLERVSTQNQSNSFVVSAGITNQTAFTIRQVNLPVAVYDNHNQIVAVNFTYINDVKSGETRTFQYSWPTAIPGALRAEITPQINIFDRSIFTTEQGVSEF